MKNLKIAAAALVVPLAFLSGCTLGQSSTEQPTPEHVLEAVWSETSQSDREWFCKEFQADPAGTLVDFAEQIDSAGFSIYVPYEDVAEFSAETCGWQ